MMRIIERKTTIFCGYISLQEVGLVFYKKQGLSLVKMGYRFKFNQLFILRNIPLKVALNFSKFKKF